MPKPKVAKSRRLVYVNSPDMKAEHINNVLVKSTPWDIEIILGRVEGVTDDQLSVQNLVRVYMSPEQAQSLVFTLRGQLEKFEKAYGPIRPYGTNSFRELSAEEIGRSGMKPLPPAESRGQAKAGS